MFVGFASLSVPFSFAIAALWKKRWDGWIARTLPWALLTFLTLGTAILMGGYWAYKTLGMGRLLGLGSGREHEPRPWLFTAALVHGMFLQKARKRHRKINLILACTAYATILYGTFLTRSGVLADFSVHSFIDLGITGWLVAILGSFVALSIVMLAFRWRSIPARRRGGDAAPVAERALHPGHRRLLRARPRHPARDLGPAPHAAVGHALAGPDVVLRRHDDAGGIPAAAALRPRRLRLLEGRDARGSSS